MDFSDATLYKLSLFVVGLSILIGVFAGWSFSELVTQKYKKKKKNYSTIIGFRLGTALFGGFFLSIITHYLLDILQL
jgi:uncharacterized protein YneF (UPF0154 family)